MKIADPHEPGGLFKERPELHVRPGAVGKDRFKTLGERIAGFHLCDDIGNLGYRICRFREKIKRAGLNERGNSRIARGIFMIPVSRRVTLGRRFQGSRFPDSRCKVGADG